MRSADIRIKYRKLKDLETVLKKWIKIQESFSKKFMNDSLYWHNERANLSTLAGAAWKCRGFSLEEYGTIKKNRKDSWSGRSDLWFRCGNTEYYVEAKKQRFLCQTGRTFPLKKLPRHCRKPEVMSHA